MPSLLSNKNGYERIRSHQHHVVSKGTLIMVFQAQDHYYTNFAQRHHKRKFPFGGQPQTRVNAVNQIININF